MAEIESHPGNDRPGGRGTKQRFYCPFHGSDKQQSLEYNTETGHFRCFNGECLRWGYLADHPHQQQRKQDYKGKQPGKKSKRREWGQVRATRAATLPQPNETLETKALPYYQDQLTPDSIGAAYLASRGIPLDVAREYGLGYAPYNQWAHRNQAGKLVRQPTAGRLVFPHTDPAGRVVNLYGRACAGAVPDQVGKHDHLPGQKGAFNAQALQAETVYITEGAMDALSLIAAGYPNACAIFGVNGLYWEWVKARTMVFCMDQDAAGQQWRQLATVAIMRGIQVKFLEAEAYEGHKDLNELWAATGEIDIIEPGWIDLDQHRGDLEQLIALFVEICEGREQMGGAS